MKVASLIQQSSQQKCRPPADFNKSTDGTEGLGIIRGNKVGESEYRDSNVEFAL